MCPVERFSGCGLGTAGSVHLIIAGPSEHINEPLGFTKDKEIFLTSWAAAYMEDFAPLSCLKWILKKQGVNVDWINLAR